MKTVMAKKKKKKSFPWGIEMELTNGRCIYVSARSVEVNGSRVDISVNNNNIITVPRKSVRKIMLMRCVDD